MFCFCEMQYLDWILFGAKQEKFVDIEDTRRSSMDIKKEKSSVKLIDNELLCLSLDLKLSACCNTPHIINNM